MTSAPITLDEILADLKRFLEMPLLHNSLGSPMVAGLIHGAETGEKNDGLPGFDADGSQCTPDRCKGIVRECRIAITHGLHARDDVTVRIVAALMGAPGQAQLVPDFLLDTVSICSYTGTTLIKKDVKMNSNTIVRARIDSDTKARATEALQAMGLSMSDAIRLLLLRVAEEKRLPFTVQAPNTTTVKAMKELAEGKGKRFNNTEELFRDIGV